MEFYTNALLQNNKIYLRGYRLGQRFQKIITDYKPYIFVKSDKLSPYKTIHGDTVGRVVFADLKDARETINQYEEVDNFSFYGMTNFLYPFLNDTYPGKIEFDLGLISVISIDIEVASLNGFPNIEQADSEVTAITMVKNGNSITFGTKPYTPTQVDGKQRIYMHCPTEQDMLKMFLGTWGSPEWQPDIVTGWSSDLFDMPYLINRVKRLFGKDFTKRFSPFKLLPETREIIRAKGSSKNFNDRKDTVYEIPGITILDYLQLYKKFTLTNHPSYALNAIAQAELNDSKVDYGEYDGLDDLYERNPQLFFDYNIKDALIVSRLDDKLKFINTAINIAYRAKVNYTDAMTTLRPWDVIIHNYLLEQGIVIPQYKRKDFREILGGYVKDPQLGLHKWIISFDFDSLYPSIISQHNISPETFIGQDEELTEMFHANYQDANNKPRKSWQYWKDRLEGSNSIGDDIVCANGTKYRRDIRGFIPAVIDMMVAERKSVKNKMLDLKKADKDKNEKEINQLDYYQQGLKVLGNGLYGALSNQYFRWYDSDLAEAVTSTSQVCTQYVEQELNKYLRTLLKDDDVKDYVVAADTDSCYVNLEPLVVSSGAYSQPVDRIVEFLDKICEKKFGPIIERHCLRLCDTFKVYTKKLHMKREGIIDKAIWRSGKMYVLSIWDQEGVRFKEPEIKTKGIEAVRSSTPVVCRAKIKEAIKIILTKDEKTLQSFIAQFKDYWWKLPFEDIAFPRTCNGLTDYSDPVTLYKLHTPVHVKAALVYNAVLKEMELSNKYRLVKDKEKVKWIYLRTPNPFRSSPVIAASDNIPEEFGLDEYIDRETQWQKSFLGPVQSFTNLIGWKTEPVASLEEWM